MCTKINGEQRKMQMTKKVTTAIALLLILSFAISLVAMPAANAHTPPWTIISYAYLVASPSPVGVGQTVSVTMWIDTPLPGAAIGNDVRRHDYTLTITNPNGKTDTQHWDVVTDSTSIQFYQFVPDVAGNYTIKFDYGGQTYTWSGAYQNDVIEAASKTITLTVQQEPIPAAIDSYPLPTEYWTRPIEGQNTYWYTIGSNWLGAPYIPGAAAGFGIPGAYQPYGSGPNTAHVMWTKTIQYGGVVGGNDTSIPGEMYYQGGSYNVRYSNALIMQGTLFYQEPSGNSAGGGDYVAVDLTTGQELWRIDPSATGVNLVPSFGYLYSFDSPNQHGVVPNGWLMATSGSTWRAYDPRTGKLTSLQLSSVPSGTNKGGPTGEYLKYVLTNLGTSANPNYYLMQWNSSNVFVAQTSGNIPANCPITPARSGNTYWNGSMWVSSSERSQQGYASVTTTAYDWNVSVNLPPGSWSIGTASLGQIPLIDVGNMMLLIQGTFGGHPGDFSGVSTTDPANITAISLKPQSLGNVLWTKSYPQAPGNNTRFLTSWDPGNEVFVFADKESLVHYGYSLADGSLLWGPVGYTNDFTNDWNYLALGLEEIAYGRLYVSGYSGILYCFDDKTGDLLWTYGNGGEGNSTLSGFANPWGRYPIFISVIADEKVYLDTDEHSPNSPLYKGARFRCVNATDGTEIWTVMGYGNQMYGGQMPIADGYWAALNTYDCQIYCFGQGPSQTTVTAPDLAAPFGTPVVIKGIVTDISAGTKQNEQAARFPNGVPAVSDASMSSWMEYIYEQKPRPTETTGVSVSIDVVDSNDNYRNIGTATTDADGMFICTWTPDIPGTYKVVATFAGSQGYWPSHAETAFTVMEEPTPTAAPTPMPASNTDTYVTAFGIGIIIAIVVVGAVLFLMFRKRP
jgi:outer membrane protein assembly factor BamB